MTVTDYTEIVAALRAVPGVAEADVEPGEGDEALGTLRLGLAPGVDEVQVATRVGRLLRERFGLGVDAEKVQLLEDARAPQGARSGTRPIITRMQIMSSGLEVTAVVSLAHGSHEVRGESTGTATQAGVHRAVANATLRAVEQLVGSRARFEVEHVEVAATGSEKTVLVALTMVSPDATARLSGSAGVRDDVRQAVIRASLDAVNRRLEPLLR